MSPLFGRRLQGKFSLMPSFAAAMAFYFLVSLVPFLIVVSRAAAFLFSANLTPELAAFLRDVLPPESSLRPEAVAASVSQARGGFGTAGTVLAVWTASSGLNEMARAVHFIFSEPEKPSPGGWGRRGKAFVLLAIWTAAIAAGAVAFILLPMFQGELARIGAARLLPGAFASTVRYPAGFFALFCAFALTYALVPEKRPSWSRAAQGALLAAGFWSGVSLLFAYLLPRVWHVSLFGGALGSALAILVWAYCGAWGVLLGASWAAREA